MSTATIKPVKGTGKKKTSARTASGAADNSPTERSHKFEKALDATAGTAPVGGETQPTPTFGNTARAMRTAKAEQARCVLEAAGFSCSAKDIELGHTLFIWFKSPASPPAEGSDAPANNPSHVERRMLEEQTIKRARRSLKKAGLDVEPFPAAGRFFVAFSDETPANKTATYALEDIKRMDVAEKDHDSFSLPALTQNEVLQKRANNVTKVEKELAAVRSQMEDDDSYDRLKVKYPRFILFKECDKDPELKSLLLGIKSHHQRKCLRFAKQIAANHSNVKLNTIEKAWDKYNPNRKPRQQVD